MFLQKLKYFYVKGIIFKKYLPMPISDNVLLLGKFVRFLMHKYHTKM